jgi:ABC transporter substrate binding protein (PQQ-dependent alcohol dehydrogenase system)
MPLIGVFGRFVVVALLAAGLAAGTAPFVATVSSADAKRPTRVATPVKLAVKVGYLGRAYDEPPPLSLIDKVLTDNGVQGARIGIKYNATTGRLLGHGYELVTKTIGHEEDIRAAAAAMIGEGVSFIVADLEPKDLLAVSDLPEAKGLTLFNIRSSNDDLRGKNCRRNLFHVIPSWAQRADALAQYLIWKQWRRWFLIAGKQPSDLEFVAAIKRAAKRFGGKIVEERSYEFEGGNRRTDDGHQQVQTQMPLLTQRLPEHEVVFVADASEVFGDYLMWRTFVPRPVVGTHGLIAVAWHRSFEQYAGTQMQNRFEKLVGRTMTERDYAAWLAVRIVGEAVLRSNSDDPATLRNYIMSDKFKVAGFKGQGLNFRGWNHQLRQPVLLSGPRTLVSISPQPRFLHQRYLTDTLGIDEPESRCQFPE